MSWPPLGRFGTATASGHLSSETKWPLHRVPAAIPQPAPTAKEKHPLPDKAALSRSPAFPTDRVVARVRLLTMGWRTPGQFARFTAALAPSPPPSAAASWRRLYASSSAPTGGTAANGGAPRRKRGELLPTSGSYPRNFLVAGVAAGIKRCLPSPSGDPGRRPLDLALVASATPGTTHAAAVFTKNLFAAAPVVASKAVCAETSGNGVGAVVINSGCANAVTGAQGLKNAWGMIGAAEAALSSRYATWSPPSSDGGDGASKAGAGKSVVMSTGVIGQPLDMDKVVAGIGAAADRLGSSHEDWLAAAEAVMTTDTFPKLRSRTSVLPSTGTKYRFAGFSKGAGMIHPDMATMLAVIATDAPVRGAALRSALTYATERSFNAISVDGDTSTNDTLLVMANGACALDGEGSGEGKEIPWIDADDKSEDYVAFREDLASFAAELAQLIVRDGEGATKFIIVKVKVCATRRPRTQSWSRRL
ncbi:MAG: ArgJ family-domain-containing protein [Olpidium bornovanus]|uniref:Arginine biosynthesis bifunctional protein ArgJ, mitochondrial n=1 Tax=Olpidium bornovanus TaxID=278681 RepID=A0A8H7ZNQ1_9FUNG|nr:MAG: ArgJ family-domain-containing protein [Olpidium bornovanus]